MGSLSAAGLQGKDLHKRYGGFYFACVMKLHSDLLLLNGTFLGVTFVLPSKNKLQPKSYLYNYTYTIIYIYIYIYIYTDTGNKSALR